MPEIRKFNIYNNISVYVLYLSVCLCLINDITAKPKHPKFGVGPHITTGEVYGISKIEEKNSLISFLKCTFLKEKCSKFENELKWQTFRATVKCLVYQIV